MTVLLNTFKARSSCLSLWYWPATHGQTTQLQHKEHSITVQNARSCSITN